MFVTALYGVLKISTGELTLCCAGHPDVSTPALDRLAQSGVRFTQTYCAYPLGTPARAKL